MHNQKGSAAILLTIAIGVWATLGAYYFFVSAPKEELPLSPAEPVKAPAQESKAVKPVVPKPITPKTTSPKIVTKPATLPAKTATRAPTASVPPEGKTESATKIIYYLITGSSASELRSAMDKKTREAQLTTDYAGYTASYLRWTYSYYQTPAGCQARPVHTTVTADITIPQWGNYASSSDEMLKSKWTQYVSALTTHENGHAKIAIQAGENLFATLLAIPAQSSCAALAEAVRQQGEKALEQMHIKDAEYDSLTEHGASQGARFP